MRCGTFWTNNGVGLLPPLWFFLTASPQQGDRSLRLRNMPEERTHRYFWSGFGNDKPARDLRLSDLLASEIVFVDDTANFNIKLTAEGFVGETVVVKLIREGDSAILDQKSVTVTENGVAQKIRLSHRPDTMGEFDYAVVVDAAEGEVNRDNNRETQHVSVRDETIRVLLAGSLPSFEYTYLKRLLNRQVKKNRSQCEIDRTRNSVTVSRSRLRKN